jgi:hypothetical protein
MSGIHNTVLESYLFSSLKKLATYTVCTLYSTKVVLLEKMYFSCIIFPNKLMYHVLYIVRVQYKNFGLLKNTLVNNVVYVHYVVTIMTTSRHSLYVFNSFILLPPRTPDTLTWTNI